MNKILINCCNFSVTPPRDLEGDLSVNDKLNGAVRLFVGQLKNPESFAVVNKTLFTGVQGGKIVKIVGDQLVTVASINHPCGEIFLLFLSS
jgi:hypothetical protein